MVSLFRSAIVLVVFISVKDTHQSIWPCESDDNCTIPDSFCSTLGRCECKFGLVFATNFEKCLTTSLYGEECEDSAQCNLMPSGSSCKQGVCECDDSYTYVRGKCRQLNGLGQSCNEDTDCYFGYDRQSVACKNNNCTCADGYYERYGNICRQKSMAINDNCVVDSDCENIVNGAKCDNYKCVPLSAVVDRRQSREIAVQTSLDILPLKPISEISTELTDEKNDEFSVREERASSIQSKSDEDANTSTSKYGESCTQNSKPCEGLSHSICVENKCYCQQGYYQKNGKCLAELGEVAETKEACEFEWNDSRVCSCVKNYFYESSLRACKKPITFNLSCTSNSQCSPFGAAYCHPVIPRRCRCLEIAELDEKRQLCVYKQGLGAPCENNASCTVPHSMCSPTENVCSCIENYVPKGDICVAGVGAECVENEDCGVPETVCESSRSGASNGTKSCHCRKGFVHFKDECLKEAEDIGENCLENEQCQPLLAKCNDNKCSCGESQHFSYGKCEDQKGVGDACARAGECYMPSDPKSVECRNSVCQCKVGYQNDVEKRTCIKIAPKKNSSGRPSALKIITFLLIGSAFVITTAAIKQAYYE